jgi:hypothetical protein
MRKYAYALHTERPGKRVRWTKFDEPAYDELSVQLRARLPLSAPFWKLEEFWTVTDAGDTD